MKTTPFFLILSIVPFLLPIKKATTPTALNALTYENKITDSLFIGEPLISDSQYIRNIKNGGEGYYYVHLHEKLLKKHNSKFLHFKSKESIKTIQISKNLKLELKRSKFIKKDNEKDIRVILYTKFNEKIIDSLLFYQFEIDKLDVTNDQRFETLTYIEDNLTLWQLKTSSSRSELDFQPLNWSKYQINDKTGKIDFKIQLDYNELSESKNQKQSEISKRDEETEILNNEVSFLEGKTFLLNCNHSSKIEFGITGNLHFIGANAMADFLTTVKKAEKNKYDIFYKSFRKNDSYIMLNNEDMTKDISKNIPIGELEFSDNEIKLTWLGFYNVKTKKREILKNPLTNGIENKPIVLTECNQ